jgi:hypothetical protein
MNEDERINYYGQNQLTDYLIRYDESIMSDYSKYFTVADKSVKVYNDYNDDLKEIKKHISEMQTEINNLRATNQVLAKSFRDLINEMKIIINEKKNK